jgi:hypothetical protein
MKNAVRLISIVLVASMLALGISGIAVAQNPHLTLADTYTDINNPTVNHGSDTLLLLSATNAAGCVPVTYLWYQFSIPATAQTLGQANLYLAFENIGGGATLDMELRSSPDTTWTESGLTWANQPALDPTILATALSVPRGSTATFSSTTLSNYLDAHKGQPVTLVVRANCSGTVAASANRGIRTKENASGSGVYLDLFTPTAVSLVDFTADSATLNPLGIVGIAAAVIAMMALLFFVRRRAHSA